LEERLILQQNPKYFPISLDSYPATKKFVQLEKNGTIEVNGVKIENILQYHPGSSYGYRIMSNGKTVVYSTDSEHKHRKNEQNGKFIDFFKDYLEILNNNPSVASEKLLALVNQKDLDIVPKAIAQRALYHLELGSIGVDQGVVDYLDKKYIWKVKKQTMLLLLREYQAMVRSACLMRVKEWSGI